MIRRKNNAGLKEISEELRAIFPKLNNIYVVERTNPTKNPVSDKINFALEPDCERSVIAVCFDIEIVT